MPFSDFGGISENEWTEIYEEFFRPAVEDAGLNYVCERSQIRNGAFTKDIVQSLKDHYVVLADITYFNPNVMWELGVRHALSKRTIMVSSHEFIDTIPSDIRAYGIQPYKTEGLTEINAFKKKIKELLSGIEKDPERNDNPVFDFLKVEDLILLSYERRRVINKLNGLITELAESLDFANRLLNNTSSELAEGAIASTRYYPIAVNQFLTENYVTVNEEYLNHLLSIRRFMYATNSRLEIATATDDAVHRKAIYEIILYDARFLKETISTLIPMTINLRDSIKSNLLDNTESPIIISEEVKKQFFS